MGLPFHPQPSEIPFGLCQCGCGERTTIAAYDHKARGAIKGQPRRFIMGHNGRKAVTIDYRKGKAADGRRAWVHRLFAELALGKPLPPGAVVHHVDGTKGDASPLVICQDQAYHMLLHVRMRIKARGGNPNTDACCSRCHQAKPRTDFTKHAGTALGVSSVCRQCKVVIDHLSFTRRKQALGAYWRKASA